MDQERPFFQDEEAKDIPLEIRQSSWEFQRKQSQMSFSQQMFGDVVDHEQSGFEQNVNEYRKHLFRKNVQNYVYSRGIHYHVDLDTLERVEHSATYVKDYTKSLRSTFSQEEKVFGSSKLKDIINREYITLPVNRQSDDYRPSRAKNPSHSELFNTEDKKVGFDRSIFTFRHILNNLEQLDFTGKINSYQLIYRDPRLQKMLNPTMPISQKRQMLITKLEGLIMARKLSENSWIAEDNIFYAPSCNQMHYLKMKVKLGELDRSVLVPYVYNNHYYLKEIIKEPNAINPYGFLKRIFTFSREKALSVKEETLQELSNEYKSKIMKQFHGNSTVIFPIHILSFGNPKILKLVNQIIGKRLRLVDNSEFQAVNHLSQKFFNETLVMPDELQIDDEYVYKLIASKFISKIRDFKKRNEGFKLQVQMIDEQINHEDLNSERDGVFVLKRKENVEFTGIEYLILMYWHWLGLIIKEILPFLQENPEFIDIIASPHYSLINLSASQAFKSPLVSTLNHCIEQIRENLREGKYLHFDSFRLEFEYNSDKSIGILWRVEQIYSSQEEAEEPIKKDKQVEEQESEIDYDLLYFGKRVKSLDGEWV